VAHAKPGGSDTRRFESVSLHEYMPYIVSGIDKIRQLSVEITPLPPPRSSSVSVSTTYTLSLVDRAMG
jgi:hypothetical protein